MQISLSWYEHMTYRVLTMFRGSLITLIYEKTLRVRAVSINDAEAITLVSADIDRIGLCMQVLHDAYASLVELALSLWLLHKLLGIAVLTPTVFIVGKCSPIRQDWIKLTISKCVLQLVSLLPLPLGMPKRRGLRQSRNVWL